MASQNETIHERIERILSGKITQRERGLVEEFRRSTDELLQSQIVLAVQATREKVNCGQVEVGGLVRDLPVVALGESWAEVAKDGTENRVQYAYILEKGESEKAAVARMLQSPAVHEEMRVALERRLERLN